MICVIDLSNKKYTTKDAAFFTKELLSVLSSTYSIHTFYFITSEPDSIHSSEKDNIHELSISSKNNLLSKWMKRKAIKNEIEKYKPDVYFGAVSSVFSKQKQFCLFVSTPESLKALVKTKTAYKNYFTTDWFCYHHLITEQSIKRHSVYFAPSAPAPGFQKVTTEKREKTKQQISKGCEYFFILNPVRDEVLFINLLKAFSFFKKRQQSSMKLMITNQKNLASELLKLLTTYKYKQDVLFTDYDTHKVDRFSITAAAYTAFQTEILPDDSILPQEALACGVPVVICAPSYSQPPTHSLITSGSSAEEIAGVMMLIYKDEQYRKQIIQQGLEEVSLYTHQKNANMFVNCMQKAAQL
jgi:glycosyltransferase involved in cell wall biosynthesis